MRERRSAPARWGQLALAAAAACLAGCAHVYTSKPMSDPGMDSQGLVYALPTTWLEIKATSVKRAAADGGPYEKIDIRELVLPDADHLYSLDHAVSDFAKDEIVVEVGADQLLDSVHTTTKDATSEIVLALVRAVSGLASFAVPPVDGFAITGCRGPAVPSTLAIDPFDDKTWPHWMKGCLTLEPIGSAAATLADKPPEDCRKGICHRSPIPYRARFDFGEQGVHEVVVGLLGEAPVLSIDVDRAMFVEKKVNLDFEKGVLTKMSVTRPSPVLGAVTLPVEAAKAILAAPAEIFKLRVDYSSQAIAAAKKDQELIETKRALDEALRKAGEGKEGESASSQ